MNKWSPLLGNIIYISEAEIAELDELSYEDILSELVEGCPK